MTELDIWVRQTHESIRKKYKRVRSDEYKYAYEELLVIGWERLRNKGLV